MRVLVLGGTGWLGTELARAAHAAAHEVVCLARGRSGPPPDGVAFVASDRSRPGAYDEVRGDRWDVVFDLSSQPGQVREAVGALAGRVGTYAFVSSISVYASHGEPGLDEDAPVLEALAADVMASLEHYGEAKVACERHVLSAVGPGRALVVRPGLIAGPGDPSDRTGYWPLRFARPASPDGRVLVPCAPEERAQVIDVRDLAGWLLAAATGRLCGVFNATGPTMPLADHLDVARNVAGHEGPVVAVPSGWLRAHGVQAWAGPRSLPLWTGTPGLAGIGAHQAARALAQGMGTRPLEDTLADTLAWERGRCQSVPRAAGLADDQEGALLEAWAAEEPAERRTTARGPGRS